MREDFERWYLQVVKGHPNNLQKNSRGEYAYVGQQYLAFEAATLMERKACANVVEAMTEAERAKIRHPCDDGAPCRIAAAIRMRSNVEVRRGRTEEPTERPILNPSP